MKKNISKKGYLAVTPPEFKKIEARVEGGLARAGQRTMVAMVELVMDYFDGTHNYYTAGSWRVILDGTAGLQGWAKKRFELPDGREFCLVPEGEILGFERDIYEKALGEES